MVCGRFLFVGFSEAIFIHFLVTCFLRTLKMAYDGVKNVYSYISVSEFRHYYRLSVEKNITYGRVLGVINAS